MNRYFYNLNVKKTPLNIQSFRMHKAFLSHSSKDKSFVEQIAKELGDKAIYDHFSFETSNQSLQEILDYLGETSVFVFFITENSLESNWVKREFAEANLLSVDKGLDRVMPLLMDDSLDWNDHRIPKMFKNYTLRPLFNTKVVLNKINNKLRKISIETLPLLRARQNLFVGRNELMDHIESMFSRSFATSPSSIIASGLEGIGRRTLIKESLRKNGVIKDSYYEPITIKLDDKDYIENFILQLANHDHHDVEEVLTKMDKNPNLKINLALEFLDEFEKHNELIFILDDGSIVKKNRKIAPWFLEILDRKRKNKLAFAVASTVRPLATIGQKNPEIIHVDVPPLNRSDIRKLFVRYAKLQEISMSDNDLNLFVEKLNGLPDQIIFAIDLIKKESLPRVKRSLNEITDYGDQKLSVLLEQISRDEDSYKILVLLAQSDLMSFQLVEAIVQDDDLLFRALNDFYALSLYSSVGPDSSYIKLNSAVSDYVNRSMIKLDKVYKERLNEELVNYLSSNSKESIDDLSKIALTVGKMLKNRDRVPSKYLLPSYILKSVEDLYYSGKHLDLIRLTKEFIDSQKKMDEGVLDELRYWRCQSFAWLDKKDEFHAEVNHIIGRADREFLYGFFYRKTGNLEAAEKALRKSLKFSPGFSKSKRELVTVLLKKEKYQAAEDLARETYLKYKTNAYHIQAYFICLIRGHDHKDTEQLKELLEAVKKSHGPKSDSIQVIMEAEYHYYVNDDVGKAIRILEEELDSKSTTTNKSYAYKALDEIFTRRGMLAKKQQLRKKYSYGRNFKD